MPNEPEAPTPRDRTFSELLCVAPARFNPERAVRR